MSLCVSSPKDPFRATLPPHMVRKRVRRPPTKSSTPRPKRLKGPSEHEIQSAFFKMIDATGHPAARRTIAVVNGACGGSMRRIVFFMAEGLRPGAADVLILHAGRGAHYAAIEFKKPGEVPRPNQVAFLQDVVVAGGAAEVFTDAEAAFRWWAWYVGLGKDKQTM